MASPRPATTAYGLRALILVGVLWVSTAPAFAQPEAGLLGTVTNTEGLKLEAVSVVIEGEHGTVETHTDAKGRFRFDGLKPGTYHLTVSVEGYSKADYSPVTVRFGRPTTVRVQLAKGLDEVLVVATEPAKPSLTPNSPQLGGEAGGELGSELDRVEAGRDPFSALAQVPGVQVDTAHGEDRVVGLGAGASESIFFVDGVEGEASPTAVSSSSRLEVTTGGASVLAASPGVLINLTTPAAGPRRRAEVEATLADRSWQSPSSLDGVALADAEGLDPGAPSRIDQILTWGADAGLSLLDDRLWLWGAYHRRDLDGTALGGAPQEGQLEHSALKLQALPWHSNSLTLSGHRSERRLSGVGAAPDRELESSQVDYSPSTWLKLEDSQQVGSDFQWTAQLAETRDALSLTPLGENDAFLDEQGVWRGGYLERREEIDAQNLQVDLAWSRRVQRGEHEVRLGVQQREASSTRLERWGEGNLIVLAGENYGTPFDLVRVRRSGDIELERDVKAAWIQDRFTFSGASDWTLDFGLRYDGQSGRALGGTVAANALLPELLPTVDDAGGESVDLTHLLPRFGAAWAPGDAWSTTVRWGWSRFASRLRDELLESVSPLAATELILGFDDLDQNRRFDPAEPYVILDRQGPDTLRDFNTNSRPELRSELTDEWRLGIETRPTPTLELSLGVVRREVSRVLDARRLIRDETGAVRLATVADYRFDTLYSGVLPDGSPFSVPVYTLAEGLELTGANLVQNGERRQVYEALTLGVSRRLSGGFMLRANVTWSDWHWQVTNVYDAFDDPTDTALGDLDGVDDDGAAVAQRGADSRWVNSRWSFDVLALVQVARNRSWGFDVSTHIHGREGFPIPYSLSVVSADRLREVQVTSEVDSYRLDDVMTVDLRLAKEISLGKTQALLSVDVFNLLDEGEALERESRLSSPQAGAARAVLSPRVVQFGIRLALR